MSFPNGLVPVPLAWHLPECESVALEVLVLLSEEGAGSSGSTVRVCSLHGLWLRRAAKPVVFRKDIGPSKALFLFLHFAVALPQKGGRQRRVGSRFPI